MKHCRLNGFSFLVVWILGAVWCAVALAGGGRQERSDALPNSGRELYRVSCAACHGFDGRGAPAGMVGFDVPLPDFTDCNFTTREAAADWITVVREGGPARGFSEIMPEFGDALTQKQITKILLHIRTFADCDEWPRGELNLPRAIYTTKAFPEDELVIESIFKTEGGIPVGKISGIVIFWKENCITSNNPKR